ncbi:hypothetical protein BCR32DRAFT_330845 [Anaeromyces robustus]|uniref:IPT/TIG domain-containing protein n=2 Tax=Anaeromyces robustus TaxID=1754192 RepID=A0A1Y1VQC8_9FUNG|nr:hypothetical protein BCR32DRAFT_330954 [Anaeromyces robustus]ORX63518.1 hypothetical protein BCR32DRAFT_330845 [Anaeromyces robustus]|eukprot:ORX54159.1 hypothetical protein BCR32DRAFT_330954 [Anaeromyces robustus]
MMSKVFSSKFFTFLLLILQLINVNGEILKLRIQKKDYHLNERIDITFPSNVKCQSGTVVTLIGQNQNKYGNTKLQCQNTSRGYLKLPSKLDNSYEKVDNYFLNWNYGNSQIQTEPFFKLMNNPNTDSKKDKASTSAVNYNSNNSNNSNNSKKDNNGNNGNNNNSNNGNNGNNSNNGNNNNNNNNNTNNKDNNTKSNDNSPSNLNDNKLKLEDMPVNKTVEEPVKINNNQTVTESIDEFDNVKTDSKVNPKEKDANGKNFKNNILFGVVFLLIGCVMVLSVRLIKTSSENKTIKNLGRQILEDRRPNPNLVTFPALRLNPLESRNFSYINNSTILSEMFISSSNNENTTIYQPSVGSVIPNEDSVASFPLQNRKNDDRSIFSTP